MWKYIRDNTRVPGLVMGDLEAQIASAELGVKRFEELLEKYGKDDIASCNQLMDYTERLMRREIAKIPDGEYFAEGFLDDDGRNREKTLLLRCVKAQVMTSKLILLGLQIKSQQHSMSRSMEVPWLQLLCSGQCC